MRTIPSTALSALPTKRKRAQIYYAEPDLDPIDSAYESGDESALVGVEDEFSNGGIAYGSRKKPTKPKKRAKVTVPRSKKPQKPFPFLALPAELRDYIYELALTDEGGLALTSKNKGFRRTIARGLIYKQNGGHYYCNGLLKDDQDGGNARYVYR